MLGERRKDKRHTINQAAKFVTESGALPRDCLITNISDRGARLFTEASDIPDSFQLLIFGETAIRQECRVIWRLGGEIGVTFVTRQRDQEHDQKRQQAMKELQSQVRNAFRQVS
jgi:hypothetical protein